MGVREDGRFLDRRKDWTLHWKIKEDWTFLDGQSRINPVLDGMVKEDLTFQEGQGRLNPSGGFGKIGPF